MQRSIGSVASSRRVHSRHPDVIAAGLLGGEFDYLPMPGRPFAATLRTLQVGDFCMQQGDDAPHVMHGAFAARMAGIVLPIRFHGAAPIANGVAATDATVLLAPGGAEFSVACPDATDWAALTLPRGLLEELAELAPPLGRHVGTSGLLRIQAAAAHRLGAAIVAAARIADDLPEALAAPGCAAGLADAMRELLGSALTGDIAAIAPGRAAREALRVMRGAEDYLRANLHRPIYRDELRTALGVSHRKLHDAFIATVGMAPATYLKLRRLALARRALLCGGTGPTLVKTVALSHGFWHLGYFAQDYRALFGELPSETVAAARAVPRGAAA